MPSGLPVLDTMIGFPKEGSDQYAFIRQQTKDRASREEMAFPAEYMFKGVPRGLATADPVATTLHEMDRWGVTRGLVSVDDEVGVRAVTSHPDRFVGSVSVNDPNDVIGSVRKIRQAHEQLDVRAATVFPAGAFPQVPIDDAKLYPVYAICVEPDIPVFVCAGIPGPRVPFRAQDVALIDQVMFDFPDLVLVTRHGCEPWTDLAVKLMLKWPNLHYSTSAFAPKHYPAAIVDYANSRGADKVLYAGYFPMGLSLERIATELPSVPFKDEVWPKFLHGNAARILRL
jgi:predicted TIM-barrel fold metal-dependent hydrolase